MAHFCCTGQQALRLITMERDERGQETILCQDSEGRQLKFARDSDVEVRSCRMKGSPCTELPCTGKSPKQVRFIRSQSRPVLGHPQPSCSSPLSSSPTYPGEAFSCRQSRVSFCTAVRLQSLSARFSCCGYQVFRRQDRSSPSVTSSSSLFLSRCAS